MEATKDEIQHYATSNKVESISLYVDVDVESTLNEALDLVGVYCEGGTGTTILPAGWLAYDGFGIKIGIIENNGKYDNTSPHLRGNSRIQYINTIDDDGTIVSSNVKSHATTVTSIIAGRPVAIDYFASNGGINTVTYTGVVPGATVYQTSINDAYQFINSLEQLADLGVNVVNVSLALGQHYLLYKEFDKEIDRFLAENDIVVVSACGNNGENSKYVVSPSLALNVISVGNVDTTTPIINNNITTYPMAPSSSSLEAEYLPNKPDIVAPGTNITYVVSENRGLTITGISTGTSFAAPIVTGIVAQMMQANSSLKADPLAVKAALLLGADDSVISTENNDLVKYTSLRDKSGVGMVNAINAMTNAFASKKNIIHTGL